MVNTPGAYHFIVKISGSAVNGTRFVGSSQWKIPRKRGKSKKVGPFSPLEFPNGISCSIYTFLVVCTSSRSTVRKSVARSLRVFRAKRQYYKPPRSRLGFREETQNYAKRNRSQIFFLTCFVYRITSVIINQRFLQIVENIIIRLIIKEALLQEVFVLCLLFVYSRKHSGLALTKLQNDHAKNIRELVSRGWLACVASVSSRASSGKLGQEQKK